MPLYTIKKNKRRISILKQFLRFFKIFYNKKEIRYKVKFTESCIYDLDKIDLCGVNKLFGLSFGWNGVHKNSARFGWKPTINNKIMIYAYSYVGGIRAEHELCEVELNNFCDLKIIITDNKYIFSCVEINKLAMDGKHTEVIHGTVSKWSYENFLYFGGLNINPQDINIFIE